MTTSPIRPVATSLCHNIRQLHLLLDARRLLQDIDVHALADVPCDVAVERPDTWNTMGGHVSESFMQASCL